MKSLFVIISVILCLSSCNTTKNNIEMSSLHTETAFLMGTLIEISTYNEIDKELSKKAFERIKEIESKMTINSENTSEIITLNNYSGKNAIKLSEDTFYVLSKGKYYSELSKGKFDITIGPLIKIWNIGTDNPTKPPQNLIDEKLNFVDYNMLELYNDNKSAKLINENMVVDLGAIAKGYAADEAKKILIEGGINSAIINIGGNIITIGTKANGDTWKIGIQNPFSNRGEYLGIVQLEDKAVVSSGDYEKYFEQDGIKYNHIIDPATGYPCNNELTAVSIITKDSIDADGLSTTAFLMGLKNGINFINTIDGVEAIFITKNKKIYCTEGIDKNIFTVSDKTFEFNY